MIEKTAISLLQGALEEWLALARELNGPDSSVRSRNLSLAITNVEDALYRIDNCVKENE